MPAPSKHSPGLVQLATSLGFVVVLIDVSVVNVALDTLHTSLAANVTDLQWVVNAYSLVFASALLLAGTLGDRFGARTMLMLGYALFALASAGCGLATDMRGLILWRLFQGIGAALLVPNSLAVLRAAFQDPAARGRAIGWWGAGGGIALAAGPLLGGMLIATSGWRSIFLVNLPVGIVGLWLTWRFAPVTTAQPGKRLDLPGQLAGALALAALTFAATEASALGWQSPVILSAMVLCMTMAAAFVWLERRNPHAMLPAPLWRNRVVRSTAMLGLVANLVFYGIVFVLSLLFQSVRQMTPLQTGMAFLPMMGILMGMNVVAGRLAVRFGPRALATSGLLLSALGYLAMAAVAAIPSSWPLAASMLVAGSGIALTIPTITAATLNAASAAHAGIASGLLNTARQIGGVLGVALFGFLVHPSGAASFLHGLRQALIISVALLVLAAVTAWRSLDESVRDLG